MDQHAPPEGAGSPLAGLIDILDVRPLGQGRFEGLSPRTPWTRLYGGQLIGQALMAACKQAGADRMPHALHLMFLRPGDPAVPIVYATEVLRAGRAFTAVEVRAEQGGTRIATATVSLHADEPATVEHDTLGPTSMPPLPRPGDRDFLDFAPPPIRRYWRDTHGQAASPVDIIPVDADRYAHGTPQPARQALWMRCASPVPDTPGHLAAALLAYLSDMTLLDTALAPAGRTIFSDAFAAASLDHALWLHRPVAMDDWLLYLQDSPIAARARGFARGGFYDRDGQLVASTAQEGIIRTRAARGPAPA